MILIKNEDRKRYHNDIIKGITELVKIPTVYDKASVTDHMPYGKNVYSGLQWMKEKAISDGFEVLEYDGHALAIRRRENTAADTNQAGKEAMVHTLDSSKDKKRIDVVSHIDVVEPGTGWRDNPFSGKVTRRYIHGRGTQDMKGSLIITYYALKYMTDHQIPCKNEIRLVIGSDEERTMQDIRYYISKAGEPAFAFTPDGKFPFSLGEKGALMWHIKGRMNTCIEEFDGGVQCNVVSPKAVAVVNDSYNLESYKKAWKTSALKGEIIEHGGKLKITVYGKAAHASMPQKGVNATVKLLELIQNVNRDPLSELLYRCFYDYNGKGGNIGYDIPPMGKLTLNLGILNIKDKTVNADIDCRYPYGISSDSLTEGITETLKPLKVELKYDDKPTLADANSPYIKCLLNSYRSVTSDLYAEPIISGGVTYSKAIGNCVAFGPAMDGTKLLAHQANEKLDLRDIDRLFKIYTEAMIQLGNLS